MQLLLVQVAYGLDDTATDTFLEDEQMRRGLYIEPRGGLCNRMRTIESAVFLAQDIGKPLYVIWTVEPELGCAFEDLFEFPVQIKRTITVKCWPQGYEEMKEELEKLRKQSDFCILQPAVHQMMEDGIDFCSLRDKSKAYISTWEQFYNLRHTTQTSPQPLISVGENRFRKLLNCLPRLKAHSQPLSLTPGQFALFRPVKPLQAIISGISTSFKRTVGVHLRRTDNPHQDQSPTSLFVARMKRELESYPETDFFLATDDPNDEEVLVREFPGRIRVYPKRALERSKREAIEDALVDLYCLSETIFLLGTYYSTFTLTAAEIKGIPLEVLRTATDDLKS
jgi:hypothetical protein